MAFQLHALHHASTFNEVAKLYGERAHKFRDDADGDPRSLSPHGKPYVTIRPLSSPTLDASNAVSDAPNRPSVASYALRYHDTDVVRWDRVPGALDRVTVRAWPSMSTEVFADAYTPWNITFEMRDGDHYVRLRQSRSSEYNDREKDRVYAFDSTIQFTVDSMGDAHIVPGSTINHNFIVPNSGSMQRALNQTNYSQFRDWARSVMAMRGHGVIALTECAYTNTPWLVLLADPNNWPCILFNTTLWSANASYQPTVWLDAVLAHLRDVIYRATPGAIQTNECEWYSYDQHAKQKALRRKYFWV